ncbi:MAG: hypothetical protein ACI9YT_002713 [Halobacteriales archaeon]|jgi:hypothetical protein
MSATLEEKTERYERLLADGIDAAEPAGAPDSPLAAAAEECLEMAEAYLDDGRHFRDADDPVNALAAFSYGHGWLDAAARIGVIDVPTESHLFTV